MIVIVSHAFSPVRSRVSSDRRNFSHERADKSCIKSNCQAQNSIIKYDMMRLCAAL
ncbi:hypothetical protein KL86PLE_30480 [uncultured Pleomorphomonas sp.]|uniref:Uncharacterized protein n=1 Tax=uncultured Pleomorphomonas sp. TaxID=442121 RepID=A0A212LEQ3_9HYPH|nr:hypothetical protein KL86PLE_30480 [uncultured Pleomorphomonas sp.]